MTLALRGGTRWRLAACVLAVAATQRVNAQHVQFVAAPQKAPLLVLADGDLKSWKESAPDWNFASVSGIAAATDPGVKQLEAVIAEARKRLPVDDTRVYLAAEGNSAAGAFYAISRQPDLWSAAAAVGGDPEPAIHSNHLYGANTRLVPLLWSTPASDAAVVAKLRASEYNLEVRSATRPEIAQWLGGHSLDAYPDSIDCETGNPRFGRCYWLEMTGFDASRRNDALPSTRVPPGSGAYLAGGAFGFDPNGSGPGVLVASLPEKYSGPLAVNDRIVSIAGRPISDARHYARFMDRLVEEKPAAIIVEREGRRIRMETGIVLPRRDEVVTARLQAHYLADMQVLEILSRSVSALRLTLPAQWAPTAVSWNGTETGKIDSPGCWLLNAEKDPATVRPCN
jgi:hypothetical protein